MTNLEEDKLSGFPPQNFRWVTDLEEDKLSGFPPQNFRQVTSLEEDKLRLRKFSLWISAA